MEKYTNKDIEFKDQKIVEMQIEKEVKKSFLEYSMSVIVSRALPDVRDGLKPVHRRILYAMYEDNLVYSNPHRKSATTVGNVLGRYHPHGDAAVYDAMVRLAQPFSLRYPLVDGKGNFGNVDGDGAAAYRYTEAKMSRLADYMLSDIEKNVVDYDPNFDNTRKEPRVLPARFPNLLVNGSVGIAVGMATNVPPHNLREVIDGTVYLMENPDAEVKDLMTFIKGPDFPTYATIHGTNGIYEAYTTGHGRVSVRAKAEVFEDKHRIEIYEIPYMVNKSMLVMSMAELVKAKKIEGITALRDESGRHGMKIVVEYRRDANGQVILNQLYKYTQLQDTCAINMLALVNGEPKCLGLKEILQHYIAHQEEVICRRVEFDLDKAKKRAHILAGLHIAIDNIDEVIRIIRSSKSIPDAKEQLCSAFDLDDIQAQAIVEMQLGKLSNLETVKIEEELAKLNALIIELQATLADKEKVHQIIKDELIQIRDKFGDERRTRIEESDEEIVDEDLIERENCVVTLTYGGYIKMQPVSDYSVQNKGGKGMRSMATKEDDFVINVVAAHSHSYMMMFTNTGRVFMKKVYSLPRGSRTSKGSNIVNVIDLAENEKITALVPVDDFSKGGYLLMVTKNGTIKKTKLSEFEQRRKGGKIAILLDEGNELLFVQLTDGNRDVVVCTHEGQAVCFNEKHVRDMGRASRGVRGIRLAEDDFVTGATLCEEGKKLLSITENGYGKRTEFENYTVHGRGGKGVVCHKITEESGKLAGIASVADGEDIIIVTTKGVLIRFRAEDVRVCGRAATGVIVVRFKEEGDRIVNFTHTAREEEKSEEETQENEEIQQNEETQQTEQDAE